MPAVLKLKLQGAVHRVLLAADEVSIAVIEAAIQQVRPGLGIEAARYLDEDGDLCSLGPASLTDFLGTAAIDGAGCCPVLKIELQEPPPGRADAAPAPASNWAPAVPAPPAAPAPAAQLPAPAAPPSARPRTGGAALRPRRAPGPAPAAPPSASPLGEPPAAEADIPPGHVRAASGELSAAEEREARLGAWHAPVAEAAAAAAAATPPVSPPRPRGAASHAWLGAEEADAAAPEYTPVAVRRGWRSGRGRGPAAALRREAFPGDGSGGADAAGGIDSAVEDAGDDGDKPPPLWNAFTGEQPRPREVVAALRSRADVGSARGAARGATRGVVPGRGASQWAALRSSVSPWPSLRSSVDAGDHLEAAKALCDGLDLANLTELLPVLRGLLGAVVEWEDQGHSVAVGKGRKPPASSAFARFTGLGKALLLPGAQPGPDMPGENGENADGWVSTLEQVLDEDGAPSRRWRRSIRAMFSVDAAMALLDEVRAEYKRDDFSYACSCVNDNWRHGEVSYEGQKSDIDSLCLERVLAPVLLRYGFSPDERGSKEIDMIIGELARGNPEVKRRNTEVQRLVLGNFPRLGSFTPGSRDLRGTHCVGRLPFAAPRPVARDLASA